MKSFRRPNPKPADAPQWRDASGHYFLADGSLHRKQPKLRGKAAVKAYKQSRHRQVNLRARGVAA